MAGSSHKGPKGAQIANTAAPFAVVLHGAGERAYINTDCAAKSLLLHLSALLGLDSVHDVDLATEKGQVVDLQSVLVHGSPAMVSPEEGHCSHFIKPRTTYVAVKVNPVQAPPTAEAPTSRPSSSSRRHSFAGVGHKEVASSAALGSTLFTPLLEDAASLCPGFGLQAPARLDPKKLHRKRSSTRVK